MEWWLWLSHLTLPLGQLLSKSDPRVHIEVDEELIVARHGQAKGIPIEVTNPKQLENLVNVLPSDLHQPLIRQTVVHEIIQFRHAFLMDFPETDSLQGLFLVESPHNVGVYGLHAQDLSLPFEIVLV